jgi:acyl-CoA thioester hydrolase
MKKHFTYKLTVQAKDIDILNHANNEAYLSWLMKAAGAHSTELGFPVSEYIKLGAGFVVRRHEIDYLASALLNDELIIETWCGEIGGTSATREYKITRPRDEKILVKAKSLFIFIDLKSGRPKKLPEEIVQIFKV